MEEKEEYGRIQGVRKRAPFYYYWGSFNNYGDKKRWVGVVYLVLGDGPQKPIFVPHYTLGMKSVLVEVK